MFFFLTCDNNVECYSDLVLDLTIAYSYIWCFGYPNGLNISSCPIELEDLIVVASMLSDLKRLKVFFSSDYYLELEDLIILAKIVERSFSVF